MICEIFDGFSFHEDYANRPVLLPGASQRAKFAGSKDKQIGMGLSRNDIFSFFTCQQPRQWQFRPGGKARRGKYILKSPCKTVDLRPFS
jgi:hypothetical protein